MFVAGIDIGSLTAKAVILDRDGRIMGHALIPTGPISRKAGESSFDIALTMAGIKTSDVEYVLATGYGRKNIRFAKGEMTEITCHARGAHHLLPEARTIIDIGGQDSKAISVNETGAPTSFMMNDKCAAGSGRFLEVMAQALQVKLDEMGDLSLRASKHVPISSMCTVFAESEVVSAVARGCDPSEIIRGIHEAIAKRVAVLVENIGVKEQVIMTGGVANNAGVVRALEKELHTTLLIPQNPQLVGALGAALIALDRWRQR